MCLPHPPDLLEGGRGIASGTPHLLEGGRGVASATLSREALFSVVALARGLAVVELTVPRGVRDHRGFKLLVYHLFSCRACYHPIGVWDVSSVTSIFGMFRYIVAFDQPIGGWDVSSVTTLYGMLCNTVAFGRRQRLAIGDWVVSGVTFMCDEVTVNLVQL